MKTIVFLFLVVMLSASAFSDVWICDFDLPTNDCWTFDNVHLFPNHYYLVSDSEDENFPKYAETLWTLHLSGQVLFSDILITKPFPNRFDFSITMEGDYSLKGVNNYITTGTRVKLYKASQ